MRWKKLKMTTPKEFKNVECPYCKTCFVVRFPIEFAAQKIRNYLKKIESTQEKAVPHLKLIINSDDENGNRE